MKKFLTNESENDKLLRLIREKRKSKKEPKKFLTTEKAYGIINKLVAEKSNQITLKKLKKFLTKRKAFDKI